jgi:hypothetical protein
MPLNSLFPMDATEQTLEASDRAALTEADAALSKILHQIYRLRLHDNK